MFHVEGTACAKAQRQAGARLLERNATPVLAKGIHQETLMNKKISVESK